MVDSKPDPDASNCVSSRVGHCGLYPDGSPEEGEEDVRDGLDGSDCQGFPTPVDSGSKRKGASLALWDIGGAKEVCCRCQKLVAIVGANGNLVKWCQNKKKKLPTMIQC